MEHAPLRGQIALFLQLRAFSCVGYVGFEGLSIVAFDDAGHLVHTAVANLDVVAVKDLVKRGGVLVNQ